MPSNSCNRHTNIHESQLFSDPSIPFPPNAPPTSLDLESQSVPFYILSFPQPPIRDDWIHDHQSPPRYTRKFSTFEDANFPSSDPKNWSPIEHAVHYKHK